MEVEHILKLVAAVSESELTEFSYKEGAVALKLSKKQDTAVFASVADASPLANHTDEQQFVQVAANQTINKKQAAECLEAAGKKQPEDRAGDAIKSPLVGTFYSSPSPEESPFIKVGDKVKKGQTLGIVEAMKLMNEIESEYDGVVQEVLVQNEELVEYGQPLFVIG